jgi:ribosomal protein L11 methyltransferase
MSDYIEITSAIDAADEESLAQALTDVGVLGAVLEALGPATSRVSVWVASGQNAVVARIRDLLGDIGSAPVRVRGHEAADWSAAWRDGLTAFAVGERWWIDPHGRRPTPAPDGRFRLVIEPRAAFGSGTHESTRLVLVELEHRGCGGAAVLDLGTGSGVLAVAAATLGAGSVVALDIDPLAAWEARRTVLAQTGADRPLVVAGVIESVGSTAFELVLCNMTLTELRPLLGDVRRVLAPGGSAVLSGLLAGERDEVEAMLLDLGLFVRGVRGLGEWICVVACRPSGER